MSSRFLIALSAVIGLAACDPSDPPDPGGDSGTSDSGGMGASSGTGGSSDAGPDASGGTGGTAAAGGGGATGGSGGTSGSSGTSGNGGTSVGGSSSGGTAGTSGAAGSSGNAGSGGGPPVDPMCGDGWRDPATEECDDGNPVETDVCTNACRVRDSFVSPDGSSKRWLGHGSHVAAASADGSAVVYLEGPTDTPVLRVSTLDRWGAPTAVTLDVATVGLPLAEADPVVAALPDGKFAVAWADLAGGSLDISLQLLTGSGLLPAAVAAHAPKLGAQSEPDLLWTGTELVVAYRDGFDLAYRTFDASLTPIAAVQPLAATSEFESSITLANFGNTWAAAWRAGDAGSERIRIRAGTTEWHTGPFLPGASGDRPALVELDESHLLVVFTEGTDPNMLGVADVSRLRAAVLDTSAPGLVTHTMLDALNAPAAGDLTLAQRAPSLARVGTRHFLAWENESAAGDAAREELWLQELQWSAGTATLTQLAEIPLSVDPALQAGRQSRPALAATPLHPGGALVTAWEDRSGLLPTRQTPDVLFGLRPVPLLDLPDAPPGG